MEKPSTHRPLLPGVEEARSCPGPSQKLLQSEGAAALVDAPPCRGFVVTSPPGVVCCPLHADLRSRGGPAGIWAETQGRSFLGELDGTHWLLFILCGRPAECSSQACPLSKEGEITKGNSAPVQVTRARGCCGLGLSSDGGRSLNTLRVMRSFSVPSYWAPLRVLPAGRGLLCGVPMASGLGHTASP